MKSKSKRRIAIIVFVVVIVIIGVNRFYKYVDDYYKATDEAWSYINSPAEDVKVEYIDNTIVYEPAVPEAGFIFYPGGLVETEAYAPLLEQLAEQGVFVVEVEMPYYLAFLDANGAKGIQQEYPGIKDWYIGGHSLGGAMASLYVDRHINEYEGLILLAAYSTKDISEGDLKVLSIRGTEDKVLKMDKYNENLKNLPDDFQEVIIEGGCHSYFGDYGIQSGDGQPTILVAEQREITVNSIMEMIEK